MIRSQIPCEAHASKHVHAHVYGTMELHYERTCRRQVSGYICAATCAGGAGRKLEPVVSLVKLDECGQEQHHPHTEYWGDVVRWGSDQGSTPGLQTEGALECCR